MNELIESDPELYAADVEKYEFTSKSAKVNSSSKDTDTDLFNDDEISLEDPEEARENFKLRKE